jgi:2-dehydropantoate 2-reductase
MQQPADALSAPHLKHAVLGSGAVGMSLAADLARSGESVTLVMRRASLDSYDGLLRVRGGRRAEVSLPVPAVDRLVSPVDVLWIAVKQPQLHDALRAVDSRSVDKALIVPLLNGIDHLPVLRAEFQDRVLAASIRVEARRSAVGEVVRDSLFTEIEMATPDPDAVAVRRLAEALRNAGIRCRLEADASAVLWRKLVFLAPMALATAGVGGTMAAVRSDPSAGRLMLECAREAAAVATACGVPVDAEHVVRTLTLVPDRTTSSLQRDAEAGEPVELDAIGGALVRAGRRVGVRTPAVEELVRRISEPAAVTA